MGPLKTEAAISWGAIGTAIGAAIVLLRSFGLDVTQDQENSILKFAVVGLPIIVGLIIRGFVYSHQSIVKKTDEAFAVAQQGAKEPPVVL